jgi:hypothetical protein
MHTCQTGSAHLSHSNRSLEFQIYDVRNFPEIDVSRYDVSTERFVAGQPMKSGQPRPKNAISFYMECEETRDIHDCIEYFVMKFIVPEFPPGLINYLGFAQAFVRFHLPMKNQQALTDFSISADVMRALLDRNIALDFWFLR